MIKIVGVAHVINLKNKIYAFIDYEMPDAIAIELDQYRFKALLDKTPRKGFSIFNVLGRIQREIANAQNVSPGEEMLSAYEKGKMLNRPVFFIDMDINTTYEKFKKEVRFVEKIKIIFSIILSLFPRKSQMVTMNDVLKNEREYMEKFRNSYPTFAKVLLDDREDIMAKNLLEIEKYGKVIAFVGDGHLEGLKKRIPNSYIIPLKEFIEMEVPNNEFRFSIKL